MASNAAGLNKEDRFELLSQIHEKSSQFLNDILDCLCVKEKEIFGHAERVYREKEGLLESMNSVFEDNLNVYFQEELMALREGYDTIINEVMTLPINIRSTQ